MIATMRFFLFPFYGNDENNVEIKQFKYSNIILATEYEPIYKCHPVEKSIQCIAKIICPDDIHFRLERSLIITAVVLFSIILVNETT